MRSPCGLPVTIAVALAASASAQLSAAAAYAPSVALCPAGTSLLRKANASNPSISRAEADYVASKRIEVLPNAWASYLANVQANAPVHLEFPSYVADILSGCHSAAAFPTLGIATSGGGDRAAIFGAGMLNAFDARNASSALAGTGGILQAATYLSGLSGGSWLVTSLAQADFPMLPDLMMGPTANPTAADFGGWLTQFDIFAPSTDATISEEYLIDLVAEIAGKFAVGFPVTIVDVWSRALSRHFVNGTNAGNFFSGSVTHGAGQTFSSIANLDSFRSFVQPFPIIVADSFSKHENNSNILPEEGEDIPLTNPIYEFNVFEFGSFDPILAAFTPTEFLGSPNDSVCVTGFDQTSFIEGISSNVFHSENTSSTSLDSSQIGTILAFLNTTFPQPGLELDSAIVPNPFMGISPSTFIDTNETQLLLVDGGTDAETIPIQPLLVKSRGVDVIIAIDAAADTDDNFSNGDSLIATQDRVAFFPSAYSFPSVPTNASDFAASNMTTRPAFFGCSSSSPTPLVIYIANGGAPQGQVPVTNTSTALFVYTSATLNAMLDQTFDIATQGRPASGEGIDVEWPACLACAVVERSRERMGFARDGVCNSCFERYCFS